MTKNKAVNKITRRIIGISALVFLAIVVLPRIILPTGDRLAWQLQGWMLIPASIFTMVYVIMDTIHTTKNEDGYQKFQSWMVCSQGILICIVFFLVATFKADYKVWGNGNYVIYGYVVSDDKHGGFCKPSIFKYYKRKGIVDHRLGIIGDDRTYLFQTPDMSRVQKIDYTIYEAHNLLKEEMCYMPYESDSVCHLTSFYRLSDGCYYDYSENDYFISLINQ